MLSAGSAHTPFIADEVMEVYGTIGRFSIEIGREAAKAKGCWLLVCHGEVRVEM